MADQRLRGRKVAILLAPAGSEQAEFTEPRKAVQDAGADVDVIGKGTRCVNASDVGSTWLAPTFSNLSVGWQQYQPSTGALEMWMDDLVVSAQRVGCPAP